MKMEKLSLDELKAIAEMRVIEGQERMSKERERLRSSINESKPEKKSEKNFDVRIENIKIGFNKLAF